MAQALWWTLGSVLVVSAISLIGVLVLAVKQQRLKNWLLVLVALAAGTLVGDALLHLLPHHAEEFGFSAGSGLWVLGGVVLLFIIERFVHWHHCHDPHLCEDPHSDEIDHHAHVQSFGWSIVVGDGLHNVLDGALIAASYLVSVPVGVATTLAVALHEIPQEIADFGVLLHAGFSKAKALLVNFGSALTAFVGAGVVLAASEATHVLEGALVPLTAGAFLYIAMSDLLPELEHEEAAWKTWLHFGAFLAGIALMGALLLLE